MGATLLTPLFSLVPPLAEQVADMVLPFKIMPDSAVPTYTEEEEDEDVEL